MKKAFLFLSNGFEEVEAVTPIDYLRRAGIDLITVGVQSKTIVSARKISIVCDMVMEEAAGLVKDSFMAILPGGMPNAQTLADSTAVKDFVSETLNNGGIVGAICASSALALGSWGLLDGKKFTCYPSFDKDLTVKALSNRRVVRDGNIITACGAGAAEEFAFALIEAVSGKTALTNIQKEVIAR